METNGYIWSPHAEERADKRFGGIDKGKLIHSAKPAKKSEKKRIRKTCPISASRYMQGWFQERHYLVSRHRYVFVIEGQTIITCWDMAEPVEFDIEHLEFLEKSIGYKQSKSLTAGEFFGLIYLAKKGIIHDQHKSK